MTNGISTLKSSPPAQGNDAPQMNNGPSISSITIHKAVPFFDGKPPNKIAKVQANAKAPSGELPEILLQAEKIKQENIKKIGRSLPKVDIPPMNL